MHRRLGFLIAISGMVFTALPLATVLRKVDFAVCVTGLGLLVLGIFFTIETVSKQQEKR